MAGPRAGGTLGKTPCSRRHPVLCMEIRSVVVIVRDPPTAGPRRSEEETPDGHYEVNVVWNFACKSLHGVQNVYFDPCHVTFHKLRLLRTCPRDEPQNTAHMKEHARCTTATQICCYGSGWCWQQRAHHSVWIQRTDDFHRLFERKRTDLAGGKPTGFPSFSPPLFPSSAQYSYLVPGFTFNDFPKPRQQQ